MLSPDAPPRKRKTRNTSPELVQCLRAAEPGVSSSAKCHPAEAAALPALDGVVVVHWSDGEDIGGEIDNEPCTSESSTSRTQAICDMDKQFQDTEEEWLRLTDACDSEHDIDSDHLDDTFLTPTDLLPSATVELDVLQAADDEYTFNWSKDGGTFLGSRETFTGTSGPTFDLTDQTPIDIFDKMFDVDFIDILCRETNRYAERKLALMLQQNVMSTHSRFTRWTPTHRDEMITFLTIIILQGLYPMPEEEAYFSFNGFGTMPYFAKIMALNRFILLKTMLHFVDNDTVQDTTTLWKIRPVIDYFNEKFSTLYMPSQEIAIDESLLKWHGRQNIAQKNSSKASKVGVRTYELCESSSAYLWRFFVYRPNDEETTERLSSGVRNEQPTNATASIVYDLIKPLLHRGHTLTMDSVFNSPLLLRCLKKQKTDCFGPLRLNREFVPDSVKILTETDLRRGEVVAMYCSDLSVVVWRDANLVSLISTYHNLQIGTTAKNNRLTYKPSAVLDYNKTRWGVDRKEQYLSGHPVDRVRNRVWYKKLFRRIYNAALLNCYVIYSVHQKISNRKFRTVLAEGLLKRHRLIDLTTEHRRLTIKPKTIEPRPKPPPRVDHNHFPIRTGSKNTCCYMCPKRKRTVWKCEECDVNLCIDRCFKAYHKL